MKKKSLQKKIAQLIVLHKDKNYHKAIQQAQQLLKKDKKNPFLYNLIGSSLCELGDVNNSIIYFKKTLLYDPKNAEAYTNLGNAFEKLNRLTDAIDCYKKAIDIKPDFPNSYHNLAIVQVKLNRYDAAIANLYKAVELKPDYTKAYESLSITLSQAGRSQEIIALYEDIADKRVLNTAFHLNVAKALKYTKDQLYNLPLMLKLLETTKESKERVHLLFAVAKAYEDLQEYDKSFFYLKQGNESNRAIIDYDIKLVKQRLSFYKQLFMKPFHWEKLAKSKKKPIFILGMPRSGTTLVEQIISSHSTVYGAGELEDMRESVVELAKQKASTKSLLLEEDFIFVQKRYMEKIAQLAFNEGVFTDKMPHNFMHIGFILEAFPDAKIIHLNRDPMAVCWSMYKILFPAADLGYAFTFEELAEFFKIHEDLMNFWRQRYPGRIYEISYEALTTNQEEETRKLLEYCGLEWEDACLEFHKSKRAIKTASNLQVKKKMYKGSSQAWKKFEKHLQPLYNALYS